MRTEPLDDHRPHEHAHVHHADMDPAARAGAVRTALRLEYFSLTWNLLETVVGFIAGLASGSIALIGFALDSVVESSSATALVWRLRNEGRGGWDPEDIERRTVRIVGWAFISLAVYVAGRSIYDLATEARPDASMAGIVLAVISVIVMPWLAARKRRMAKVIDSRALDADSHQTSLCTFISVVLLIGLAANAWLGWWWADPVAGLGIAALAAKEGHELLTTERFCAC